jgi:hypothetical protein
MHKRRYFVPFYATYSTVQYIKHVDADWDIYVDMDLDIAH